MSEELTGDNTLEQCDCVSQCAPGPFKKKKGVCSRSA